MSKNIKGLHPPLRRILDLPPRVHTPGQIQEARKTLEKLLALLQSAPVERDRFVSQLYQARREYLRTCETAGKSGRQIERCVIAGFRIAESVGFQGDFRQWEELLRLGD
jgi:hypothetical protein